MISPNKSPSKIQMRNSCVPLRMPPGPTGYPLLGNLLQFGLNNPKERLATWRKEFGDIFSIRFFGQEAVVVSKLWQHVQHFDQAILRM